MYKILRKYSEISGLKVSAFFLKYINTSVHCLAEVMTIGTQYSGLLNKSLKLNIKKVNEQ